MAIYFALTFPGVASDKVSDNERAASMVSPEDVLDQLSKN